MAAASPPPRLAYAAWIAVCLIWGTTYLAILIALSYGLTVLFAASAVLYLLLLPAVYVLSQAERPSS